MEKKVFISNKSDLLINIIQSQGFSYNNANKILRNKDVRVEGIKFQSNVMVEKGSEITIFYEKNMLSEVNIQTIYQDENILIVDKPSGIEIEGELGLAKKLNALPVHRLDRNTTGLIILAKNTTAQQVLLEEFKNHNVVKKYYAEVVGKTNFKNKKYTAYLLKDAGNAQVKIYDKQVKGSVEISTIFNTIKSSPSSSIVECELITGKTHQIRASLAYLGHPIIGDGKYGKNEDNKKFKQKTQKLHCFYIKFGKINGILAYLSEKEWKKMPNWMN